MRVKGLNLTMPFNGIEGFEGLRCSDSWSRYIFGKKMKKKLFRIVKVVAEMVGTDFVY